MCDDPAQSLFRAFSWRQKGVEVVGRTRVLRVPFRCTKEITLAAHSLLSGDGVSEELVQPDLETYELASGDKPILTNCRDLNQEIRLIEQIALSLKESDSPNQVAILCHNKHFVRHWAHLRNQGFYVETFNKMKGLEFRAVLIPHLHTAFDAPGTKDDTFVAEMRRKIFTAMTRARETLVLSYHGNFPPELAPIEPHVQWQNGGFFGRETIK
jgi:superfamily I DNA/RNA helicase